MVSGARGWPDEGDLVVCTVSNVKNNGVYVNLDEYPGREGWIFVGEVASGWVKNIRSFVREGQRVVCKVLRIRRDRRSVDLSLKAVSEERRRETIQNWKNEQKAHHLLNLAIDRGGDVDKDGRDALAAQLAEQFGSLHGAFEEAAIDAGAVESAGFSGAWIEPLVELARENIVPPFVTIRGRIDLKVTDARGIEAIRATLSAVEQHDIDHDDVLIETFYDGAPRYRVEILAPDYKLAEQAWQHVGDAARKALDGAEGSVELARG